MCVRHESQLSWHGSANAVAAVRLHSQHSHMHTLIDMVHMHTLIDMVMVACRGNKGVECHHDAVTTTRHSCLAGLSKQCHKDLWDTVTVCCKTCCAEGSAVLVLQ